MELSPFHDLEGLRLPPHHSSPSRYVNSSAHFAGTDGVAPQGKASTPIDDRVLFDQLVQVLVFGCVYEPIPSRRCRRRRRDEWIDLGVMAAMEQLVLHVHHRLIGLELGDMESTCGFQAPGGAAP
jgi:hypothetical protein